MKRGWAAALAATALTAACSKPAEPPGTLSADDERRLNEAAEMLDANAVDTNAATADEASDR